MVSTPSPELEEWCDRVLRELNEHFPPAIYGLYQPETNLPHYQALAAQLEERFGDPILARSAFLHGIHTQELRRLPPGLLEQAVLDVLEEREKLRALNARDPDVREQLLTNVLPNLRDARAIMLFVLEQLHHLDCDGHLSAWSRAFHRCPKAPPPGLEIKFKDKVALTECQGLIDSVLAPTAAFFGLQQERNAFEDASLVHFNRPLFDELLALVLAESGPEGECERLCRLLAESLTDLAGSECLEICWEWRHIGSLAKVFALNLRERKDKKDWEDKRRGFHRALSKAGFVTVVCADEASCYHALHLIHKHLRYRPTELRDYLAKQSLDGYKALHTILTLGDDNLALGPESVSVRIMPATEVSSRYRPAGRSHIDSIGKRLTSGTGLDIRVFAPDGRSIALPMGATVLEFASVLNHSWLVHLAGATVNRRPASLLHRLNTGDVVWLDLSPEFLPLPQGWKDRIASKESAQKIAKEFRFHFQPFLEKAGRNWLRERLRLQEGIDQLPEDGDLDSLLEDAATKIAQFGPTPKASSILRSLGIIYFHGRGEDLGFKRSLDDSLAMRLVKKAAREIRKRGSLAVNDLDLPEDMRLLTKRILPCPDCIPSLDQPLSGVWEGETLFLHRAGFECGAGGIPVSRERITTRPQFFVLEVRNRIGIAASILAVFQRHLVNVTELVGMEDGRQWGIIRIKADRISHKRVQGILNELKDMPDVTRLAPPDAGEAPDWETPLPPRRHSERDQLALPSPYLCGNEINDDVYFYGMINARAELRKIFGDTIHPEAHQGRMAFIKGPLRAGKTSLAKFFLRELDRSTYLPCLTAYYEAPRRGTSWSKAEGVIRQELLRRARNLADRLRIDFPLPRTEMPLVELVEHIQDHLRCTVVLAIDEAVGLFQESTGAGEQRAIESLCSQIQSRPKLLVLCIGPTSQVRYLPPEIRAILNHAAQVSMEALSLDETKSLLRAENFGLKYRIRIPHRLADSVHQMTGGNPYWTSYLGKGMWSQRENRKDGMTLYMDELLRSAVDSLFQERIPFEHCLLDSPSVPPRWPSRLLTLLAAAGEKGKPGRLTLAALREQLRREGIEMTPEELERLLDELQAQGSVVPVQSEDGRQLWSVSTPLLCDYLRYCGSDAPDSTGVAYE
jgi:hypothetical protein